MFLLMKTIFPASIIQHTTEFYQSRISVKSRAIYLAVIFLVLLVLLSLPFIKVDVAVQAQGSFQTSLLRNDLISLVGGRINEIHLKENMPVKRGDVLATIRTELLDLEIRSIHEKISQLEDFIRDLQKL